PVHYSDVPGCRDIHENTRPRFLQLERLRMAGQLDIAETPAVRCIKDAERTAAVSDINEFGSRIVTHIVSVLGKVNVLDAVERVAIKHVARAILSVRSYILDDI